MRLKCKISRQWNIIWLQCPETWHVTSSDVSEFWGHVVGMSRTKVHGRCCCCFKALTPLTMTRVLLSATPDLLLPLSSGWCHRRYFAYKTATWNLRNHSFTHSEDTDQDSAVNLWGDFFKSTFRNFLHFWAFIISDMIPFVYVELYSNHLSRVFICKADFCHMLCLINLWTFSSV